MPYQIDRFNGTPLVTVDDGTVDQTTDLKLVGRNYAGYGEIQNENFIFLLENFSNTSAPAKPLSGQIWFDTSTKKLKFYDSTRWRTTGGAEVGPTAPTGLTQGDFWFKSDTSQLYSYTGSSFVLIGPQAAPNFGPTILESATVLDDLGNPHAIVKALVGTSSSSSTVVFIIATDSFTLNNIVNPIAGFTTINQGMTLVNSATGSTSSNFRWFGTASDSDALDGLPASSYVLASAAVFTGLAKFDNDLGYTLGSNDDLTINIDTSTATRIPTINNSVGAKISFKVYDGSTKETMRIDGGAVVPGITATYDLGTSALKWRNVYCGNLYADNIYGNVVGTSANATNADFLLFNSGYRAASAAATGNTIVARDVSGNFAANVITAVATSARYADLAERFEADSYYEAGTVVALGGAAEITAVSEELSDEVFGVVSTHAAYLMNSAAGDDRTHPAVAMTGRVPVRVIGRIKKGDRLVSAGNGLARAAKVGEATGLNTIGRALENKTSQAEGVVQAVVKIN